MSILFISLIFGLVAALLLWQVYLLFIAIPDEDRHYLDSPALGFRLIWPIILLCVQHFAWLVSEKKLSATAAKLKKAGLDYALNAAQFVMAKYIAAIMFFLFTFLLLGVDDQFSLLACLLFLIAGFMYPDIWLREKANSRESEILRSLPFYLDIITLSVEAGTNLTGGLTQAVQKSGESALRTEFSRVLRDIRAGKTRADSLRDMANRAGCAALDGIVSGMIQAEKSGSSLGPILRAKADQLRTERFLKAEKKAMEAPVKLLGPLILFIFPTTFLVLGFLVLSKVLQEQLISWPPLLWAYSWPG